MNARYEFRAFAQGFGPVAARLRQQASSPEITESKQIYLVTSHENGHNVKVRSGDLEAKALVTVSHGLEQWRPVLRESFPLPGDFLQERLFPLLGIATVKFNRTQYSLEELLDHVRSSCPGLFLVHVFKRRMRVTLRHCLAELDELLINGAAIESLAVESEQERDVLRVMQEIGVDEYENLNYPLAIRRVLGLESWPENTWWR